jgi:allantoinase
MSEPFDLVVAAQRTILPGEGEQPCAVAVAGGRIVALEALQRRPPAVRTLELGDDVVLLPGLVDSHVHICEPGNTDWEGFATATRAAAAGGITTLVDMPLDSIPTTVDVAALQVKRKAADGQCHVDVGFWGGVVPGNLGELAALSQAGVLGFKCFLIDSGSEYFPPVSPLEMEQALATLVELGSPLLVHAERSLPSSRPCRALATPSTCDPGPAASRTSPWRRSSRQPGARVVMPTSATSPVPTPCR